MVFGRKQRQVAGTKTDERIGAQHPVQPALIDSLSFEQGEYSLAGTLNRQSWHLDTQFVLLSNDLQRDELR